MSAEIRKNTRSSTAVINTIPEGEQARDPTACDGMEKPGVTVGTHITVPHAWVSSSGLGQSHKDYLRGETHGHKIPVLGVDLTWWVSIFYSEENCWEKYPYHLASA